MKALTITISRQYGSGGRAIAQQLSKDLNLPWYDHEIISKAAQESGFGAWEFSAAENMQLSDYLYALSDINPSSGQEQLTYGEKIFQAQSRALEKLADRGPAIFLGRCGNYVLQDRPNCVHLFICGSPEIRARRAVEVYGLRERDAAREIRRMDKLRSAYYAANTGLHWGYGGDYDLIINTDKIGVEGAVRLIKNYMILRG